MQKDKTKGKEGNLTKIIGVTAAIVLFALVYALVPVSESGLKPEGKAALAVFLGAFALWISEPFPTYVVAFVSMIALILTNAWDQKSVLGVFGYDVIWLMVCAFILNSAMQVTKLGKRIALAIVTRFGQTAKSAILAMIVVNFAISFLIPSTTARAALMLPIAITLANIYNAIPGESNFGKLLMLVNMQSNEISTSGILTATSANVMAVNFIKEATGAQIYYSTWLIAAMPIAIVTTIISYFVGLKLFPPEIEKVSSEALANMEKEMKDLGPMDANEKKALIIFLITLFLWCTDRWHMAMFHRQIDPTLAAMIGATLCLLPGIGVIKKWGDVKIPWDLMLFSCGAYAVGMALDKTGAASFIINSILSRINLVNVTFFKIYAVVMFIALFSHIIFTSKIVRITILAPTVIAFAKELAPVLNADPTKLVIALTLPVAFTICWCITLPPQSKPNLIYYSSGFYKVRDQLLHGLIIDGIGYLMFLVAGLTWFKIVGIGI